MSILSRSFELLSLVIVLFGHSLTAQAGTPFEMPDLYSPYAGRVELLTGQDIPFLYHWSSQSKLKTDLKILDQSHYLVRRFPVFKNRAGTFTWNNPVGGMGTISEMYADRDAPALVRFTLKPGLKVLVIESQEGETQPWPSLSKELVDSADIVFHRSPGYNGYSEFVLLNPNVIEAVVSGPGNVSLNQDLREWMAKLDRPLGQLDEKAFMASSLVRAAKNDKESYGYTTAYKQTLEPILNTFLSSFVLPVQSNQGLRVVRGWSAPEIERAFDLQSDRFMNRNTYRPMPAHLPESDSIYEMFDWMKEQISSSSQKLGVLTGIIQTKTHANSPMRFWSLLGRGNLRTDLHYVRLLLIIDQETPGSVKWEEIFETVIRRGVFGDSLSKFYPHPSIEPYRDGMVSPILDSEVAAEVTRFSRAARETPRELLEQMDEILKHDTGIAESQFSKLFSTQIKDRTKTRVLADSFHPLVLQPEEDKYGVLKPELINVLALGLEKHPKFRQDWKHRLIRTLKSDFSQNPINLPLLSRLQNLFHSDPNIRELLEADTVSGIVARYSDAGFVKESLFPQIHKLYRENDHEGLERIANRLFSVCIHPACVEELMKDPWLKPFLENRPKDEFTKYDADVFYFEKNPTPEKNLADYLAVEKMLDDPKGPYLLKIDGRYAYPEYRHLLHEHALKGIPLNLDQNGSIDSFPINLRPQFYAVGFRLLERISLAVFEEFEALGEHRLWHVFRTIEVVLNFLDRLEGEDADRLFFMLFNRLEPILKSRRLQSADWDGPAAIWRWLGQHWYVNGKRNWNDASFRRMKAKHDLAFRMVPFMTSDDFFAGVGVRIRNMIESDTEEAPTSNSEFEFRKKVLQLDLEIVKQFPERFRDAIANNPSVKIALEKVRIYYQTKCDDNLTKKIN